MIHTIKNLGNRILRSESRSGQALLFSLLIMAGITAAGVGFATLIISQIRAAENIENSISATYAAESGLEKALHIVKTNRLNTVKTLAQTIIDIKAISKTFTNGGLSVVYDNTGTTSEEINNKFSLVQDESKQIDLYNPDIPDQNNGIKYLYLSWDNNPVSTSSLNYNASYGTGSEWVEVSWIGWNLAGDSFENVEKVLLASDGLVFSDDPSGGLIFPSLCPMTSFVQCALVDLALPVTPALTNFQVRIKSLYTNIDDVEVKALDSAGNFVNIPSRVKIKTIGKFGRTQQALNASMPWKIPISGLFDYVIFSEEQINKAPETNYQTSGPIEIERGIASGEASPYCECPSDPGWCTEYYDCQGPPSCTLDFFFEAEYWQPFLHCDKSITADIGNDVRASGWGSCQLFHKPEACLIDGQYTQEKAQIKKNIEAGDLPFDEGDYYVSLRALYNSNQNSELLKVTIEDGVCGGIDPCQTFNVKDLFATMANPAVTEYKTCVSQTKLHIKPEDKILFEYGDGDEKSPVNLDWYQFSNGIPPGVSERCDSDFTPLRIQIEDTIPRTETATECNCDDSGCKFIGDCLALGWKPDSFGDLGSPVAQCYKYSNTTIFPILGIDTWSEENLANGWGACLFNQDRWVNYKIPTGVDSGPYYLSARVGFTSDTGNVVKAEIKTDKGDITDTFISNDLWGVANAPENAFVECTFPSHILLKSGYQIKFSATNSDVFIDWFEITDSPPGYQSCNGSPIPQS